MGDINIWNTISMMPDGYNPAEHDENGGMSIKSPSFSGVPFMFSSLRQRRELNTHTDAVTIPGNSRDETFFSRIEGRLD